MGILVTGAGLIGTAFAREAIDRGETVTFFDPEPREAYLRFRLEQRPFALVRGDVRDLPGLIEAAKDAQAECIVHTAGLIGGNVQRSLSTGFDINIVGTRNVAETVRLCGVRRLVHISTMGVYDTRRAISGAVREDFPRGAGRGYGNFKAAKELVLEAYVDQYKFEMLTLRPANVYGFGHFSAGSSGGMKMQALLEAGMQGGTARIPASEAVANEYVYARDIGRAVDIATRIALPRDRIFNIGNGVVTPFAEVAAAVAKVCNGVSFDIEDGAPGKSRAAAMDISRAAAQLDWRPEFSLEAGFADYLAEMKRARAAGY